jgi:hypothetical protein
MLALPGAFASTNPRSSLLAGGDSFRAADPDGVVMAHFAWANVLTGLAANQPQAPDDLLGFVQPYPGYLWRAVRDCRIIRPGYAVTLFGAGDFYVRFPGGAEAGAAVYAATLDGTPISGEADDAEITPWRVAVGCPPGGLAIISTWSIPQ